MHELGIVFAMIDQLEDVAKEQHLAHIQKVTVDLGEVSGIVRISSRMLGRGRRTRTSSRRARSLKCAPCLLLPFATPAGKPMVRSNMAVSVPTATVKTRNFFVAANSRSAPSKQSMKPLSQSAPMTNYPVVRHQPCLKAEGQRSFKKHSAHFGLRAMQVSRPNNTHW